MAKDRRGIPLNGAAIRAIREALGASQTDLARDAVISGQYLGQLELGKRSAAMPEVVDRLARALRLTDKRAILANPDDEERVA